MNLAGNKPIETPSSARFSELNFVGEPQQAIDLLRKGGLLVVPAASSLKNIPKDKGYRT